MKYPCAAFILIDRVPWGAVARETPQNCGHPSRKEKIILLCWLDRYETAWRIRIR
jgi:hypothetical protein